MGKRATEAAALARTEVEELQRGEEGRCDPAQHEVDMGHANSKRHALLPSKASSEQRAAIIRIEMQLIWMR